MKAKGLTLIEVVVGLFIVSVLVIIFGVSFSAAVVARRVKLRNIAYALADEQLAALRSYDASAVADQADGPLIGVLFTEGAWEAAADASSPSPPNAFRTEGSGTEISSVMPLPENAYGDFTLEASFKVLPGAPAGWRAGFLFRAPDTENGYRAYLTATSLVLERLDGGTASVLYSDLRSVALDAWQTLSVTAAGSSLSIELNGLPVTTQTDAAYAAGKAALAVWEGASAHFDDVSIDGDAWDFDAAAEGSIPGGWERFGLSDLPEGDGTLTVETLFGDSGFKRFTAEVSWDENGSTRAISLSSDKAN
jgi:type II secretory pathway pseudopilin PulG